MKSNDKNTYAIRRKRLHWTFFAAALLVGIAIIVFAVGGLLTDIRNDEAAQAEYIRLRELNASAAVIETPNVPYVSERERLADSMSVFTEINPDFVGWITIPGTTVDYPVVRGADNSVYLRTTFEGSVNPAGAIFMDYRAIHGFDAPICLIHGHNMRNGSMFAPLTGYLNQEFMDNHSEIIILTVYGEKLIYRVFAARITDAWDSVYTLDFNDKTETAEFFDNEHYGRILILSTCFDSADRNARLLIFAVSK